MKDTKIVKAKLRVQVQFVEMTESLRSKGDDSSNSDECIRNVLEESIQDLSQATPMRAFRTCEDENSIDNDAETQTCNISQYNRLEWRPPPSTCVACQRLVKKFQFLTRTEY